MRGEALARTYPWVCLPMPARLASRRWALSKPALQTHWAMQRPQPPETGERGCWWSPCKTLDTLDTWTLTSWAHAVTSPPPRRNGGALRSPALRARWRESRLPQRLQHGAFVAPRPFGQNGASSPSCMNGLAASGGARGAGGGLGGRPFSSPLSGSALGQSFGRT